MTRLAQGWTDATMLALVQLLACPLARLTRP